MTSFLLLAVALNQDAAERLRARAEAVYQHILAAEWTKVDPFITEETRNHWAGEQKNPILAYRISKVEIAPTGKTAEVTALVTWKYARVQQPLTSAQKTKWVLREPEWFLSYDRPSAPPLQSIFQSAAEVKPAPAPLVFDTQEVRWKEGQSEIRVPFKMTIPGPLPARGVGAQAGCQCVKASLAKNSYAPGEKGEMVLTRNPQAPWPAAASFEAWILTLDPSGVAKIKVIPPNAATAPR
jgi:hypothetical protein